MEQNKSVKRLVNEKATRYDITRHCEEGKHSVARRGNLLNGLLRHFVPRNDENSENSQSLIKVKHSFTYLPIHLFTRKCKAFTLAEVLITLAVIGIVAAMTIPTVMNKYQQKVAETRLMKFYSVINNAIALSEIDNGNKTTWQFEKKCVSDYSEECIVPLFEQYFKPYLKTIGYEYNANCPYGNAGLLVNFPDGSTAVFAYRASDIRFYPIGSHAGDKNHQVQDKDFFQFSFYPSYCLGERCKYFLGKGFEPAILREWDGTEENLPCIKKIQLNGWKFPDDCNPFK